MIYCPHCESSSTRIQVTDATNGSFIERKRQCNNCFKEFRTAEVLCVKAGKKRGLLLDVEAIPFSEE